LSSPICGRRADNKDYKDGYRMTINFPMGAGCGNCLRVYNARKRVA